IAVLGDMLELGPMSIAMHRELAEPLAEAAVDLVYASGPHMRELFKALPADRQGLYAEKSVDLIAPLAAEIHDGDVVMVKGSNGSRMKPVVDALLVLSEDDSESIRRNRGEA